MAITVSIIDQPSIVSLAANPVNFVASSSVAGKTNLYIHLSILQYEGAAWVETGFEDAISVVGGEASFPIQAYFDSVLKPAFTFPEHYTNICIAQPGMVTRYRVKVWETYIENNGTIVDKKATESLTFDQDFYVVPGAVSEDDQGMLNTLSQTWWDEWVTRQSFQHWLPGVKKTSIAAVEKLYWIARRTAAETVSIAWVGSDGTTGTATVAFDMTIYGMYELCVSPAIAEQLAGKALASYTVSIVGQSETVGYTIDRSYYENQEYFLLANAFGCYETLWCRGARSGELEFARTQYERSLGSSYLQTDRKLGATRAMTTRNRKSNTGWFDTDNWFNWALALLAGEDAWIYTPTNLAPVVMVGEKSTYIDDMQEDPWNLEIEWKYSREGMLGGGLNLTMKYVLPPFYSKVAAFFNRTDRGSLIDVIGGLTAPQTGINIAWPDIATSDVLDFSDATYWDQALIAAAGWYNATTPRTCPLAWMQGWAWAEAATDATHARLFHKDYTTNLRSMMPLLVYSQDLTTVEQATVVKWLEWYFTIWQGTSILKEGNNVIIQ